MHILLKLLGLLKLFTISDLFSTIPDKDLAHLPSNRKDMFSGLPGAISIEYAKEYREDKIGQRSPGIVRKSASAKCVSPGRDKLNKHFEKASRPFNTKVRFYCGTSASFESVSKYLRSDKLCISASDG